MKLVLYYFFPQLLNLYGDRGNITVLKKRCEWRGIDLRVKEVNKVENLKLSDADLFFIGGGSDREQTICTNELVKIKSELKNAIDDGVSGLTICGGYQFLGSYYRTVTGEKLKGLNLLDLYTISEKKRLIGDVLVQSSQFGEVVGFENHGGRTYHDYETLGQVIKGTGNNEKDKQEGLIYKNLIGTYMHGPLLPKNERIADFLINAAVERKYGKSIAPLDDTLEKKARKRLWESKQ